MAATETRHDVGAAAEFAEGALTRVTVEGRDLVIARQDGALYAMPDRCTHQKYPLHDGELLPGKVKCIHHGATFDLTTGRATLPAVKKLKLYTAAEEDGRVVVTLQQA